MKVKFSLEFNQTTQEYEILMTKGKNENEMFSGCLVGGYPWKNRDLLEKVCKDLNSACERMWH